MSDAKIEIGFDYSGEEFKKRCKFTFYRITNHEENHRGFQYYDGLNIDTQAFNPTGECSAGGLYFFDQIQVCNNIIFACSVNCIPY